MIEVKDDKILVSHWHSSQVEEFTAKEWELLLAQLLNARTSVQHTISRNVRAYNALVVSEKPTTPTTIAEYIEWRTKHDAVKAEQSRLREERNQLDLQLDDIINRIVELTPEDTWIALPKANLQFCWVSTPVPHRRDQLTLAVKPLETEQKATA